LKNEKFDSGHTFVNKHFFNKLKSVLGVFISQKSLCCHNQTHRFYL